MLQSQFAEFLQLHSSIILVYSTISLVSDLIRFENEVQKVMIILSYKQNYAYAAKNFSGSYLIRKT